MQDAFVQFNEWTQAENFLLVEKLTSKSEVEAWQDVAELCDDSSTFESASFRCKAVRKFAAFHGRELESVSVEEVEKSPQGLRAWGEMNVVVPGLSSPTTPAASTSGTPTPPNTETAEKPRKGKKKKTDEDEDQPKAKRTKKEASKEQQAEKAAKEILSHLQWSAQVMEKCAGAGDELPSEWRWTRPFLEEFNGLVGRFKATMMSDDGGENISDFVDELKLSTINKSTRSLKKTYGDKYLQYLTIFSDRCQAIAAQILVEFRALFNLISSSFLGFNYVYDSWPRMNGIATKVHNMAQASSGESKPAKGKRPSKKASPKAKADPVKEAES